MSASTGRAGETVRATGRVLRRLVWVAKGIVGENRYAAYVAHSRQTHPDRPVMSERDYWRAVYRDQDENPGARCC